MVKSAAKTLDKDRKPSHQTPSVVNGARAATVTDGAVKAPSAVASQGCALVDGRPLVIPPEILMKLPAMQHHPVHDPPIVYVPVCTGNGVLLGELPHAVAVAVGAQASAMHYTAAVPPGMMVAPPAPPYNEAFFGGPTAHTGLPYIPAAFPAPEGPAGGFTCQPAAAMGQPGGAGAIGHNAAANDNDVILDDFLPPEALTEEWWDTTEGGGSDTEESVGAVQEGQEETRENAEEKSGRRSSKERRRKFCQSRGCGRLDKGGGFCKSHGGGKRCGASGCTRSSRGSSGYCIKHGGGPRCRFGDCYKSARTAGGFCKAHGGGRRCFVDACLKAVRGKNNLCSRHESQYQAFKAATPKATVGAWMRELAADLPDPAPAEAHQPDVKPPKMHAGEAQGADTAQGAGGEYGQVTHGAGAAYGHFPPSAVYGAVHHGTAGVGQAPASYMPAPSPLALNPLQHVWYTQQGGAGHVGFAGWSVEQHHHHHHHHTHVQAGEWQASFTGYTQSQGGTFAPPYQGIRSTGAEPGPQHRETIPQHMV